NYSQEAGRAGRDGKRSYAVLLFDEKSLAELQELSTLRFPSQQDIRAVYQAVVNYLQLHPGEGGGEYYDFDMADFIKKFNLNSHTALYALKSLEQEGWMAFNDQVFLPSFVGFTATKDWLYRFELENPSLEPLIKTLLRAYGGIFDQPVSISEKMLAGLLRTDEMSIKQQLSQLHQAGIMEYRPQKDKPQLLVLRSRVRTEELSLNMVAIARRKEEFEKRIRAMTGYVKESRECRSRLIGGYFGDKEIPACGICDNCLSQKQTTLNKEEFNTLHHRILNMVKYEQLKASDLVHKLSGIKKEKAWKVIEFLQAENKIDVDLNGVVRLK
ncbi:MAG TPA: RecQ family zinc-binding domain-containing protein, partial [Chitinophagaceae bacterium]|nr:RecQ family zinc-binding domain-containing protein [Chitinophagaceae bacterium]